MRQNKSAYNSWLCESWAELHSHSTIVIRMIFCNLAVSNEKLRPSERQDQRIPNLRKALAVVCKFLQHQTLLVNLKKTLILPLFIVYASLLFLECTVTTNKRKDPVYNTDTKSIFYNITAVVRAPEINIVGAESNTNGKIVSELRISIVNPKQLPTDTADLTQIGREITTIVKQALKNADAFNNYKVLFVYRDTAGAVTKTTSVSRSYKSEDITNYAYTVSLGDHFDTSISRAAGKSKFSKNDSEIFCALSYYDYNTNSSGQLKLFKKTDTATLLLTTRDLGKLEPGHNYVLYTWNVSDFYRLPGLNSGDYWVEYLIRDTSVGSKSFSLK